MKKNLRIVSAAAAALLAVAPIAAAGVSAAPVFAAAQPAANSLKLPQALVNKKTISLGNFEVSSTQLKRVTAKSNSGKTQLTNILVWNGLNKDFSVNYISHTVTINGAKKVVFQLRANTPAAQAAVRKLGYQVSATNVVKNGSGVTDLAKFSVVLTTAKSPATDTTTPSTTINAPSTSIFDPDGNVDPAISAVAASDHSTSALVGQVNVSLHGQNYTALLHGAQNTKVYRFFEGNKFQEVGSDEATHLHAGVQYYALLNDVTVNLGNSEAGKTEKFTLTKGWFEKGNAGTYSNEGNKSYYRTVTVTVDKNGIAHLDNILVPFNAYDANNMQEVHIYSRKTGNVVTSGSVDLHAVNGQLNVEAVRRAINHEYVGRQVDGGVVQQPVYFLNDIRDQLNKANIKVDGNTGYFKAPSQFTVNVTYRSVINGAEATIPVTVNVDNATATTSNEQTKSVTVMHIATLYDKNGKATNDPVLRAYNSVSVVSTPVELKDASGKSLGKFYKLAGQDRYIKVGNIDGTSRTLRHNAYVYKSNGKARMRSRKHHVVRKSGSSITTYGKSFMIAGSQMYRVGRNQYIKVANFR